MRSLEELLPDVQVAAAGVPTFIALQMLTRAAQDFLNRSEAWREWSAPILPAVIVGGVAEWLNVDNDPSDTAQRVKRVAVIDWGGDQNIRPTDPVALARCDSGWRTRQGSVPHSFVHEMDGGGRVRFYPLPGNDVDPATEIRALLVLTTSVASGLGMNAFDGAIPELPDRIFEQFREAFIQGALAKLYLIPGRDWSNPQFGILAATGFEESIMKARSAADRAYGNVQFAVRYGGI